MILTSNFLLQVACYKLQVDLGMLESYCLKLKIRLYHMFFELHVSGCMLQVAG